MRAAVLLGAISSATHGERDEDAVLKAVLVVLFGGVDPSVRRSWLMIR